MELTFSEGSKICDERDQQLHFETETFALWAQNFRLILILLKSVSNFETDTETFGRWSLDSLQKNSILSSLKTV